MMASLRFSVVAVGRMRWNLMQKKENSLSFRNTSQSGQSRARPGQASRAGNSSRAYLSKFMVWSCGKFSPSFPDALF